MDRGVCFIAMGAEFDKLGAAAAAYSRKFTDLPMHVVTNLTSRRPWPEGTTFTYFDMPTEQNRLVKVSLIDATPFDQTLFLDCDAVLQRPGVERYFDDLAHHDLCCQHAETLPNAQRRAGSKFYRTHYLSLMEKLGEPYPLVILQSSAFLFRKSAEPFFRKWRELWQAGGKRRDMPGFSLAARMPEVSVWVYYASEDKFLANGKKPDRLIQHRGYRNFLADFGLPEYEDWNP